MPTYTDNDMRAERDARCEAEALTLSHEGIIERYRAFISRIARWACYCPTRQKMSGLSDALCLPCQARKVLKGNR